MLRVDDGEPKRAVKPGPHIAKCTTTNLTPPLPASPHARVVVEGVPPAVDEPPPVRDARPLGVGVDLVQRVLVGVAMGHARVVAAGTVAAVLIACVSSDIERSGFVHLYDAGNSEQQNKIIVLSWVHRGW